MNQNGERELPDEIQKPKRSRIEFPEGGIAQLGERLHGMQEVSGSIPLTSTKLQFAWRAVQGRRFSPLRLEA